MYLLSNMAILGIHVSFSGCNLVVAEPPPCCSFAPRLVKEHGYPFLIYSPRYAQPSNSQW